MPNVELTILKDKVTVVSYNSVAQKSRIARIGEEKAKYDEGLTR